MNDIPNVPTTVTEAEAALLTLPSIHPDDDAHDIVNGSGPLFTSEEADRVNAVMAAIFGLLGERTYDLALERS